MSNEYSSLNIINQSYREIMQLYHEMSLKLGLSDSVFTIFYALYELGDGCCQKDIASYYSISRQTINSSVKNLIKEGYFKTKIQNDNTVQLFLTKKGKELLKEKIYPIVETEKRVFSKMSETEQKEMAKLIQRYSYILKEEMKNI